MSQPIPNLEASVAAEVERINGQREAVVFGGLNRILAESPQLDRREVEQEVVRFHAERMARVPSQADYPEAAPWAAYALALDERVKKAAGLSDLELALVRSLSPYLTFRGFRKLGERIAAKATYRPEKCRVAYVPDTDRGPVHIKNMDDPITHWKKRPAIAGFPPSGLTWDGTGSGLHLDDEPAEIFPLPIREMCMANCADVPGAVSFLTRYKSFWGKSNVLLFDGKNPCVAIEKCSFNFIQVHGPDRHGRNHISGMVCRDPESPIAKYQASRRAEYLRLFGLPEDGPDAAYWAASVKAEARLANFLNQPGPICAKALCDFFITPRPDGLNKNGDRVHPDQPLLDLTLATTAYFLKDKTALRWQREPSDMSWPSEPERYAF